YTTLFRSGRVGGRDPGVGVLAPDLLADLWVCVGHLPGVDANNADDPAGGAVEGGGRHHRLGELARMHLQAAVLLRLQQPDRPRLPQDLHGLVVQLAQGLVGRAEFADLVCRLLLEKKKAASADDPTSCDGPAGPEGWR